MILVFCCLILCFVVLRWTSFLFSIYVLHQPEKLAVFTWPTFFGKWLSALRWLLDSPRIISAGYSRASGKPFAVPTTSNFNVHVSDQKQIREMMSTKAPQLSFNAFLADQIYPHRTMAGFSFDLYDPHNTIAVSALKTGLRGSAALSRIQPSLESTLEAAFNRQCINDWNAEQPTYVSAAKIMHRIVGTLNARIILGEELASDPRTLDAALQYTLDGPIAAQFLRQIPCFLHGPVSSLIIGWTGAQRTLIKQIRRTVQERLSLPRSEDIKVQPTDCIQWIIEVEKKMEGKLLNVEEISKRTLSLLFGAAHQAPVYCTFVLYCLAKYPEYLQPLREEASSFPTADLYGLGGRQTPLLDSFLKETGRLFPIQAITATRKATAPFTFSDGTHVPTGNCVCVPQQAVMLDPENYSSPNSFDAFRFVGEKQGSKCSTSKFVHARAKFPFWGSPTRPCPARYYVSMIAKMLIIHVIRNYDIAIDHEPSRTYFSWGVTMIPHPSLTLAIRKRRPE